MAAAVRGLSPVIMTVRMPIWRISSNFSRMPCLTMSFSSMTPRTSGLRRRRGAWSRPGRSVRRSGPARPGWNRPSGRPSAATASAAPLRIWRPSKLTPDIRVVAEKGMNSRLAPRSRSRMPKRSLASTTIERPSAVSSAREASCAASATSCSVWPDAGMNWEAMRLPRVIVPVLSRSRVWTSPAASTARPLMASTLRCTRRSMPAIPMAESRAPIVVGMRQTSRDTRMTTETTAWPPLTMSA